MSTQVQRERGDARRGRAGGGEAKRISNLVVLISFMENVLLDTHAVLKCVLMVLPRNLKQSLKVHLAEIRQHKVVKRTSDCF